MEKSSCFYVNHMKHNILNHNISSFDNQKFCNKIFRYEMQQVYIRFCKYNIKLQLTNGYLFKRLHLAKPDILMLFPNVTNASKSGFISSKIKHHQPT